jgi:hypothetical protein
MSTGHVSSLERHSRSVPSFICRSLCTVCSLERHSQSVSSMLSADLAQRACAPPTRRWQTCRCECSLDGLEATINFKHDLSASPAQLWCAFVFLTLRHVLRFRQRQRGLCVGAVAATAAAVIDQMPAPAMPFPEAAVVQAAVRRTVRSTIRAATACGRGTGLSGPRPSPWTSPG